MNSNRAPPAPQASSAAKGKKTLRALFNVTKEVNLENILAENGRTDAAANIVLKRPQTAYMIYFDEVKAQLKVLYPEVPCKVVSSVAAKRWKGLGQSDKQAYVKRGEDSMNRYIENEALLKVGRANQISKCDIEQPQKIQPERTKRMILRRDKIRRRRKGVCIVRSDIGQSRGSERADLQGRTARVEKVQWRFLKRQLLEENAEKLGEQSEYSSQWIIPEEENILWSTERAYSPYKKDCHRARIPSQKRPETVPNELPNPIPSHGVLTRSQRISFEKSAQSEYESSLVLQEAGSSYAEVEQAESECMRPMSLQPKGFEVKQFSSLDNEASSGLLDSPGFPSEEQQPDSLGDV